MHLPFPLVSADAYMSNRFMYSRMFGGIHVVFASPREAEWLRARDERERVQQEQDRLTAEILRSRRMASERRLAEERKQREEKEAAVAAQLKEEKKAKKKEQYVAGKQVKEDHIKEGKRQSQKKRSDVFRSARNGDSAAVRKGVWEESIDAAGGEPLPGMEDDINFLSQKHEGKVDPKETLLHIFARRGDALMVEWLLDHSAFSVIQIFLP